MKFSYFGALLGFLMLHCFLSKTPGASSAHGINAINGKRKSLRYHEAMRSDAKQKTHQIRDKNDFKASLRSKQLKHRTSFNEKNRRISTQCTCNEDFKKRVRKAKINRCLRHSKSGKCARLSRKFLRNKRNRGKERRRRQCKCGRGKGRAGGDKGEKEKGRETDRVYNRLIDACVARYGQWENDRKAQRVRERERDLEQDRQRASLTQAQTLAITGCQSYAPPESFLPPTGAGSSSGWGAGNSGCSAPLRLRQGWGRPVQLNYSGVDVTPGYLRQWHDSGTPQGPCPCGAPDKSQCPRCDHCGECLNIGAHPSDSNLCKNNPNHPDNQGGRGGGGGGGWVGGTLSPLNRNQPGFAFVDDNNAGSIYCPVGGTGGAPGPGRRRKRSNSEPDPARSGGGACGGLTPSELAGLLYGRCVEDQCCPTGGQWQYIRDTFTEHAYMEDYAMEYLRMDEFREAYMFDGRSLVRNTNSYTCCKSGKPPPIQSVFLEDLLTPSRFIVYFLYYDFIGHGRFGVWLIYKETFFPIWKLKFR